MIMSSPRRGTFITLREGIPFFKQFSTLNKGHLLAVYILIVRFITLFLTHEFWANIPFNKSFGFGWFLSGRATSFLAI